MTVLIQGSQLRALLLGVRVQGASKDTANGETTLFTITGGRVLVTSIVIEVTTAFGATTSNTKLVFDPTATGADTDLCATADLASDAIGSLYSITGDYSDALQVGLLTLESPAMIQKPILLSEGEIHWNASADPGVGAYFATLTYIPLDDGAAVAAA
jgi:hypothetical protein